MTLATTTSPTKIKRRSPQRQQQPISAKDCWFVIGAHLAGSSERECSELSGLSKTITRNIIANFKKLGSPHPTKLSFTEILNSRRESQDTTAVTDKEDTKRKKRKMSDGNAIGKVPVPRKRGRPRNPPEAPFFTRAIVEDMLREARNISSSTDVAPNLATATDLHNKRSNDLCPQNLNDGIYPLDRPDTPPSEKDQEPRKRRDSLIPPFNTAVNLRTASDEDASSLPLTPRSTTNTPPLEGEEEMTTFTKTFNDNEGWTLAEDEELLLHVLGLPMVKNIKWKEVEKLFGDRHVSRMCSERWDYIRKQLIKDIKVYKRVKYQ